MMRHRIPNHRPTQVDVLASDFWALPDAPTRATARWLLTEMQADGAVRLRRTRLEGLLVTDGRGREWTPAEWFLAVENRGKERRA